MSRTAAAAATTAAVETAARLAPRPQQRRCQRAAAEVLRQDLLLDRCWQYQQLQQELQQQ
jgi:hypothetical protein